MTHDEATTKHPAGETSKPSAKWETTLNSTGTDDALLATSKTKSRKPMTSSGTRTGGLVSTSSVK